MESMGRMINRRNLSAYLYAPMFASFHSNNDRRSVCRQTAAETKTEIETDSESVTKQWIWPKTQHAPLEPSSAPVTVSQLRLHVEIKPSWEPVRLQSTVGKINQSVW